MRIRPTQLSFVDEFNDLNITTEDVNFDAIDEDLEDFQQDEIVKEALEKGVDLRHYSRQIDKDLFAAEVASIADYVAEADGIAALHTQITECESILETMQAMLEGFQGNLGGISDEIKHLQDESLAMNIKLRNREAVGKKLRVFLDKVAVSEDLIEVICNGAIDEDFVDCLEALSVKLGYTSSRAAAAARARGGTAGGGADSEVGFGAGSTVDGSESGAGGGGTGGADDDEDLGVDPADTHAGRDVIPQLEKLRLKAAARCREFLVGRIAELRNPKTNVQKQQEYVLLRFKHLNEFLVQHAPEVASEVKGTYIDTMSRMLQAVFKAYFSDLAKLLLPGATKADVIAVETTAAKGLFGGSKASDPSKRTDPHALGARDSVLEDPAAPPLIVHVAQAEKVKLSYEALFRSVQRHLLDAATSEYFFTRRFYGNSTGKLVFLQVFAKTLSLCLEQLENYLFNCFDGVALLLMINVTHGHRHLMQKRRVPVLDSYFDRVNMLLWPRFKTVFDLNIDSVRSANTKKLGTIELHPHNVTRRYTEFSAAVLTLYRALQTHDMSDEMLLRNMSFMRDAMVDLLERMSREHGTPMARCVFLINNYDQFIVVHKERRLAGDDLSHFEDLMTKQIQQFVEEVLRQPFGRLIAFVKQTETASGAGEGKEGAAAGAGAGAGAGGGASSGGGSAAAAAAAAAGRVDKAAAEALVRDFAESWTGGIEHINNNVITFFSNFKNGMEILKQALTQLLLYYTRFQDIIKAAAPGLTRELVKIPTILFEIKKYSRTF